MTDALIEINLALLNENPEVQLQKASHDCVRIVFRNRYWHFWPIARCWIECNHNNTHIGVMHYGSVAAFNEKEIVRKPELPRNHQKKWETSDLRVLSALAQANVTISEASDILGRSEWSVAAKLASENGKSLDCLLYTSPSPRDRQKSRMPSSA